MNKESQMSASGGMPIEQIALRSVDLDDLFFVITFAPDLAPLQASISRAGILQPPIVQQTSPAGRYRVVSGHKRFLAARNLGVEEVSVRISTKERDLQLFRMNLEENLGSRQLNVVEKALALDKLDRLLNQDRETILREYLPALGLGSDAKTLDLYLSLAQLEDETKKALASDKLSIATAQQLTTLSSADRTAFVGLIDALSPGKSLQRELLILLTDLARKESMPFGDLLAQKEIVSALDEEDARAPLRARRVRQLLMKRRYPRYSQALEQFETLKKKLRLPSQISLRETPFFEDQSWRLTVTFRNREDLEAARKALEGLAENPLVDRLLRFTLQEPE
jgi:ParB/RepB/Spo0J family partition protein